MYLRRLPPFVAVVALLGLAPLAVGSAAADVIQDFDGGGTAFVGQKLPSPAFGVFPQNAGPAPTVTAGGPTGSFLRLTDFGTRAFTTTGFDAAGADLFDRIAGSFDFRVTCAGARLGFSGGGCADGFQVAFLDTALYGSSGQLETAAHGTVALQEGSEIADYSDIFPNIDLIKSGFTMGFAFFGTTGAVHLGNGETREASAATGIDLATGLNGTVDNTLDGFIHAAFDLDLEQQLFSLSLTRADTTVDVFTDLDITGFGLLPFNARLGLGSRNGDAGAAMDIDNINIRFFAASSHETDVPAPATLLLLAAGLAALAGRRRWS